MKKPLFCLPFVLASVLASVSGLTFAEANTSAEPQTMIEKKTATITGEQEQQTATPSASVLYSRHSVEVTVNKLTEVFQSKGLHIFAVIDHQQAARKAGLEMQPATVIIYGAPKAGTPLMQKDPHLALRLPLKVLVTENKGKVEVVYSTARAVIAGSTIGFAEVENSLAKAEVLIRNTVNSL